mgnify:CR=1 FL=1
MAHTKPAIDRLKRSWQRAVAEVRLSWAVSLLSLAERMAPERNPEGNTIRMGIYMIMVALNEDFAAAKDREGR